MTGYKGKRDSTRPSLGSILSKKLAIPVDYGITVLGAPAALGGFLVAALVLSPEMLGAIRAAMANRLQRSVNIFLGSVVATIGLTIPAVLTIGFLTGEPVVRCPSFMPDICGLSEPELVSVGTDQQASCFLYGRD